MPAEKVATGSSARCAKPTRSRTSASLSRPRKRATTSRFSFARVLLQRPQVVFFDEPYGQLDPEGFQLVDAVVQELKAGGATVLIATHQVGHVADYADCTITLDAGRILSTEGALT